MQCTWDWTDDAVTITTATTTSYSHLSNILYAATPLHMPAVCSNQQKCEVVLTIHTSVDYGNQQRCESMSGRLIWHGREADHCSLYCDFFLSVYLSLINFIHPQWVGCRFFTTIKAATGFFTIWKQAHTAWVSEDKAGNSGKSKESCIGAKVWNHMSTSQKKPNVCVSITWSRLLY